MFTPQQKRIWLEERKRKMILGQISENRQMFKDWPVSNLQLIENLTQDKVKCHYLMFPRCRVCKNKMKEGERAIAFYSNHLQVFHLKCASIFLSETKEKAEKRLASVLTRISMFNKLAEENAVIFIQEELK